MRLIFTIIYVYLNFSLLFAETAYTPHKANPLFESWRWKTLTDLSDKGVRCFVEGKDHSMWFGTGKGLYHYDGLVWQRYFDENEVLQNPIYGICYTKSGTLYLVSSKGICHLTDNIWATDIIFPSKGVLGSEWEILNVVETSNGDIWVALYFGIMQISKGSINLFTTPDQIKGDEDVFKNITVKDLTGVYSEINGAFIVYCMIEDHSGDFWLGIEDGRTIHLYNKNFNLKSPGLYKIFGTEDGMNISRLPVLFQQSNADIINISQSIGGAVNKYDPHTESWSNIILSDQFGGDNINFSICQTSNGNIWIGGFSRIFTTENSEWFEYKQPTLQIPPTRIILKETTDGSLWMVGHLSDVIRIEYNTPTWTTYNRLLFQCSSKDGKEWYITGNGKIVTCDRMYEDWAQLGDEFPMSDPVRINCDNSGMLWALGSENGVASLAYYVSGSWYLKSFPDLCWSFHPNAFFQSKDNSIWFGANADCGQASWGLVQYLPSLGDPANDKAWKIYPGTRICEVAYALGETDNNNLICGYFKGLFEYNGSATRSLDQTLLNDIIKVESIVQDPVSGLWIGTRSQGVIYYKNDNEWMQYTVENGLVSNSVSSLLMDFDSTLWVATDKGISRFDGKNWVKYALPNNFKISRGNGYITQASDSSIWLCNAPIEWTRRVFYNNEYTADNSPLISFRISPERSSPVTKIKQYEKKVYYPGNAMIFWDGADFWDETISDELQFSYRLDKDDWSDYSFEKSHAFLSMKRGWHKLQIRARDNFLNVEQNPLEIEFKVIPPVWGQLWFLLLMAALIGAIVFLFLATAKKNREMEVQNLEMKKKNEDLIQQQKEIEEKGRQIVDLLEKERESQWTNNGLILINELIKTNKENSELLAQAVVEKLVDYLKINSSGLFLYRTEGDDDSEGKGYLELVAFYGFNKERMEKRKFLPEEGLTGTCFKEKKTMIISNVPDTYYLDSGLGKSKLSTLVIIPLQYHNEVIGIIEVASFNIIEEKAVKLIETISENLASNFLSLNSKQKLEAMFQKSQEQASQLHEQEEEMRQQMEELQATQEESQRREKELLNIIDDLKTKIRPSENDNLKSGSKRN